MRQKHCCVNIPRVAGKIPFLVFILIFCGCSSSKNTIIADSLDATPVISGAVVNASLMARGGSLVLGAFKPGAGAVADDQTDQISGMILKGIRDALPENAPAFKIQSNSKATPDYILEGIIENYGRTGPSPHPLRKNQIFMSVDGNIWLTQTGEKILLFRTSIIIDLKTQNSISEAYQVGAAIARFIGTNK